MGIYGALSTAVTGLKAQSFALENISGNIANSQTTGYKRMETSFVDLIPDAPLKNQVPGAVLAYSRSTNDVQGDVNTASTGTFMALNGSGFFMVEPPAGQSDGQPVFSGQSYYTRRGDFSIDKNGYLVNGSGYYLKGLPVDPKTGNVSGSVPEIMKLSNSFLPAQQTTSIDYRLNLPQLPKNPAYQSNVPGSELIDPAAFGGSIATIGGDDADEFLRQSIAGGAITVYSGNGGPVNVQMRWAKTASADPNATPPVLDTWNLFYLTDSKATGTNPMWEKAGPDFTFKADGSMVAPAGPEITVPGMSVNGVDIGDMTLRFGQGGITQQSDPDGSATVTTLTQNGYGAGEYESVAISDGGRVVASYSNGQQVEVYQVTVADFNAPNQLKRLDGGIYQATAESGEAVIKTDGPIQGGALEASNTDISEEFTKLIVTQQAYSAGTKIVSTANDMLQAALNMIR